jgi:hypothetical protein
MTRQRLLRFKNVLFNFAEQDGVNGVTTAAFQDNRRWGHRFRKFGLPRIHGTIYESYGIHVDKNFFTNKVHHSSDGLLVVDRIANNQLGVGGQLVRQRDRSAVSRNGQNSSLFDELTPGKLGPEHFNLQLTGESFC